MSETAGKEAVMARGFGVGPSAGSYRLLTIQPALGRSCSGSRREPGTKMGDKKHSGKSKTRKPGERAKRVLPQVVSGVRGGNSGGSE